MTPELLAACTGSTPDRAIIHAPYLSTAMRLFDINTAPRKAMFLANIGHETGGLRWLAEIWGPTPAQKRYEGRGDLGNTQPGDGKRFKGHGHLQTTGRFNHAAVRDRLRKRFPEMPVPDFEAEPYKLSEPLWAALSAGDYITMKDAQKQADRGDFDAYCDLINRGRITPSYGDSNGFEDRLHRYKQAIKVLSATP